MTHLPHHPSCVAHVQDVHILLLPVQAPRPRLRSPHAPARHVRRWRPQSLQRRQGRARGPRRGRSSSSRGPWRPAWAATRQPWSSTRGDVPMAVPRLLAVRAPRMADAAMSCQPRFTTTGDFRCAGKEMTSSWSVVSNPAVPFPLCCKHSCQTFLGSPACCDHFVRQGRGHITVDAGKDNGERLSCCAVAQCAVRAGVHGAGGPRASAGAARHRGRGGHCQVCDRNACSQLRSTYTPPLAFSSLSSR